MPGDHVSKSASPDESLFSFFESPSISDTHWWTRRTLVKIKRVTDDTMSPKHDNARTPISVMKTCFNHGQKSIHINFKPGQWSSGRYIYNPFLAKKQQKTSRCRPPSCESRRPTNSCAHEPIWRLLPQHVQLIWPGWMLSPPPPPPKQRARHTLPSALSCFTALPLDQQQQRRRQTHPVRLPQPCHSCRPTSPYRAPPNFQSDRARSISALCPTPPSSGH